MLIVNGAYRGLRAILEGLNAEHFCVSVKIDQVSHKYAIVFTKWTSNIVLYMNGSMRCAYI